jgi:hypothetical protein
MAVDGKSLPGHYRLQDLPSSVWPPPVESGDYLAQKSPPVSQLEET